MILQLIWVFGGYVATTVMVGFICWEVGFARGRLSELKRTTERLHDKLRTAELQRRKEGEMKGK